MRRATKAIKRSAPDMSAFLIAFLVGFGIGWFLYRILDDHAIMAEEKRNRPKRYHWK